MGVPSADIGSTGAYGVYHSVFDNFNWFKKFGDPDFVYEQQMARVFGLLVIRMACANVLPYDYEEYGKEIATYVESAKKRAQAEFGNQAPDMADATQAAQRFEKAGAKVLGVQRNPPGDIGKLNKTLIDAERALLIPEGLPNRPWYRHSIYAPGEYTGYAAVVIPGVNEAIDKHDLDRTRKQLSALSDALNRAANVLGSYH
jgi:N-acetylated-alpha-linked acidic dipeptidase